MAPAARWLKVKPATVSAALKRWPSLIDVLQEAKSAALDDTEWALIRAAKGGEPWAVQYFLRHQGRERGYVEQKKGEGVPTFRVEVAYTEDALGVSRPATTVTQLPAPASAERSHNEHPDAETPQIEVVEAEVTFPQLEPEPEGASNA